MSQAHPTWYSTKRPCAGDVVISKLLHRHASEIPNKIFCHFENGGQWTYEEALSKTQETAHALEGLGVKSGDLVIVWLPNDESMLRCWFALNYIGAVFVPINLDYKGSLLQHVIAESQARHMIVHPGLIDRLLGIDLGKLETIVSLGPLRGDVSLPGLVSSDLSSANVLETPADLKLWDLQMVIFTSGTTGPSKGVMCPYLHMYTVGQGCYGYMTADDVMQVDLPMFHVGGVSPVIATLSTGATMVLFGGFSTSEFWDRIRKYKITTLAGLIGSMAAFLANSPRTADDRKHTLRMVTLILTPKAIEVAERFGFDYYTGFNMSELSAPLLAELNCKIPGSCGKPRSGIECRVVDENDYECPWGTAGELVVRADQPWELSVGYLSRPEATATAWRNGWFHTGDLMKQDESGNFFFVDRLKDAVRRRGENVSSVEIESEVMKIKEVAEAAIVGIPSELGDEEILLAVVRKEREAIAASDIVEFLVPRMAHYMVPRYIRFMDVLPRTPTNKVQKYVIRDDGVTKDTWDRERSGYVLKKTRLT